MVLNALTDPNIHTKRANFSGEDENSVPVNDEDGDSIGTIKDVTKVDNVKGIVDLNPTVFLTVF